MSIYKIVARIHLGIWEPSSTVGVEFLSDWNIGCLAQGSPYNTAATATTLITTLSRLANSTNVPAKIPFFEASSSPRVTAQIYVFILLLTIGALRHFITSSKRPSSFGSLAASTSPGAKDETLGEIDSIYIYPIKSCAGVSVDKADLTEQGFDLDQRWMVMRKKGDEFEKLSLREEPKLTLVQPAFDEGANLFRLSLTKEGAKEPTAKGLSEVALESWEKSDANAWSGEDMGELKRKRGIEFQDEYPLLVASVESLNFVRDQLRSALSSTSSDGRGGRAITGIDSTRWSDPTALSMARFRPNIVLKGVGKPFSKDSWERLWILPQEQSEGEEYEAMLQLVARCQRCRLTAVDPVTAEKVSSQTRL